MASSILDIVPFLAQKSKLWTAGGIRALFPLEKIPGMISLRAGNPHPSTFPFESVTLKLKPTVAGLPAPTDGADPFTIRLENDEVHQAFQYGETEGFGRLITWLEDFQTHVHKRVQDESWSVTIGAGSQDLMYKACAALIDDGDFVLVETPVYAGVLGFLAPLPCTLIEAHTDAQGLNPASLEAILSNWHTTHPGKAYPKFLYTIPSGSNPTGASIPEGRKVEVLKLAKRYNFLLLEDDAYAFLYYGPEVKQARSYFALEEEVTGERGRVVRFDSFSKVLSSGMRLGWMTASPQLASSVNMVTASTNLQPSSLSQVMAYSLLSRWGPNGFLKHCTGVAAFYRERRDAFEKVARAHLEGLAEWTSPVAGMFLWVKPLVPATNATSTPLTAQLIAKGVLAVPGTAFMPLGGPTPYLRVSFSLVDEARAEEACKRLRDAILEARWKGVEQEK